MRYGVTMFVTDQTMNPIALGRAVEERGFDAVFLPEHTHIPVSRRTPYPGGGPLPEEYRRTLDPFVALSAMAAVTSRIRLGTGICLVAQRDWINTAKEVASLDSLSGGRFVFGVGIGWNQDEAEHHGVDFRRRRALVRERVLAMQRLWADDEAAFDGEFVHLSPSWAWPKPVQRPRPPVLIGGAASPVLFEHVAEYGDGWLPLGGAGVAKALPDLRGAFEKAGRDPATAKVVPYGALPDAGKLDYYRSIGIEEVIFFLPAGGADVVLPVLDSYSAVVQSLA
jgi:probable F420-dependent oxidoreductase